MSSNKFKFFLMLTILLICSASVFSLQNNLNLSVKSKVSSQSIFYGDYITNTIVVRQNSAGFPSYPGDPNYYGLRLIRSDCRERMVISKTGLQKEFVIRYVFQPKFVGRIAVGKIAISLVSDSGLTNSVETIKKIITVKRKEGFPFVGWIIVILFSVSLVGLGTYLIMKKNKLQK